MLNFGGLKMMRCTHTGWNVLFVSPDLTWSVGALAPRAVRASLFQNCAENCFKTVLKFVLLFLVGAAIDLAN